VLTGAVRRSSKRSLIDRCAVSGQVPCSGAERRDKVLDEVSTAILGGEAAENCSVNIAVSGLVLNFIPEPKKALSEMKRVTDAGGTVAVYLWDYAGKMDFLRHFWDAAVEIKPEVLNLHESKRFPDSNAQALKRLFKKAGFVDIETAPIEITTHFRDFDDYWNPFLGGQGPAPSFVLSLDEDERNKLRNALIARLPTQLDGSISMVARAWAAKGQISQ